ncbi:hypothetical protein, partial [Microcoleus sp. B13-B4]|uniref:hypothetical protein n=1 Tax=Microcoleus sp. B13-B4 TaxID=2818651 RepID=UPI002FD1F791
YCTIRERGRSHYNKKNAFYKTEMLPIESLWNRPKSLFIKSLLRMMQHLRYKNRYRVGSEDFSPHKTCSDY